MRSATAGRRQLASALAIVMTMGLGIPNAKASDTVNDWKSDVFKLISRKEVYPREALSKDIEGTAKVRITIDRSGHVTSYDVLQSSGHKELDEEIPRLVKRIDPVPQPPHDVSDSQLSLTVPLTWVIQ